MIFLTIGTHEPFDRLIKAFDEWYVSTGRDDDVVAQVTDRATYHPKGFDTVPSLAPEPYKQTCERASVIVSHAGMGSIITAMSYGKPIVILPRRGHLNETRNDHQFSTAKKFANRSGVFVAMSEDDLGPTLDAALTQMGATDTQNGSISLFANPSLITALRDFIQFS